MHYELSVAFWKILEVAYKDGAYNLCKEIGWTDKQTWESRKQRCKELWELIPKHWCRLAESWVSQHAWRTAVRILCVIWEPCVASVIRGFPCWFHLSLPYQNNFMLLVLLSVPSKNLFLFLVLISYFRVLSFVLDSTPCFPIFSL